MEGQESHQDRKCYVLVLKTDKLVQYLPESHLTDIDHDRYTILAFSAPPKQVAAYTGILGAVYAIASVIGAYRRRGLSRQI